jgi:hypothetical protein
VCVYASGVCLPSFSPSLSVVVSIVCLSLSRLCSYAASITEDGAIRDHTILPPPRGMDDTLLVSHNTTENQSLRSILEASILTGSKGPCGRLRVRLSLTTLFPHVSIAPPPSLPSISRLCSSLSVSVPVWSAGQAGEDDSGGQAGGRSHQCQGRAGRTRHEAPSRYVWRDYMIEVEMGRGICMKI